jgi:tetratricopeptide (TPR) repeat protein
MKYFSFFIYGFLLSVVGNISPALSAEFDLKNFEFWANQCIQLSENQNAAEALTACERAIALQPNRANPKLWFARSQALLQTGKYAEAIASYDQVLKSSPKSSAALLAQCNALVQLERYDDAIDHCDRALQLNGDWGKAAPTVAWIYRGVALRRQGYLETALASFDRAVLVQSDDPWAKAEQCLLALELNQSQVCNNAEQAVTLFEQALVKAPDSSLLWLQQGFALEQLGQHEQALTSYNQAVQLSQNQSLPLARRCGVLNQLEDYKSAIESCNQAIQGIQQPQKWQLAYLWTQHSQALFGLGKLDEAIASANRAIALQPLYPPAFNIRALAYWKQSNYAQANQEIARAIRAYQEVEKLFQNQFYRDYPETLAIVRRGEIIAAFNQGRIYSSQNQYFKAIDSYRDALNFYYCTQILSESPRCSKQAQIEEIRDAISRLPRERFSKQDRLLLASIYTNQSAVLFNIERYQQAKDWADKSLDWEPNSFAAVYNQALSHAKLGHCEAISAYDRANNLAPNNISVLLGKANVLEQFEKIKEAIAVYEQILRIDPTSQFAKDRYLELSRKLPIPSSKPSPKNEPEPTVCATTAEG